MDINEVKSFIEANIDNDEVKSYIGGFITPDRVNEYLDNDEGKKLLQPKLDSYFAKGLDSWKTKTMPSILEQEIKQRFPDADPKDVEIKNLKASFEKMQQDALRKDLTNKALKVATEKSLPIDLVDFFISDNEENTNKNLDKFIATMAAHDEAIKLEFAKGNSYVPNKNDKSNVGGDEKLRAEISKYMK